MLVTPARTAPYRNLRTVRLRGAILSSLCSQSSAGQTRVARSECGDEMARHRRAWLRYWM